MFIHNDDNDITLFTLDLNETSYSKYRAEEKLLVDFQGFLEKLLWLLEHSSFVDGTGNGSSNSFAAKENVPSSRPHHVCGCTCDSVRAANPDTALDSAGRETFRVVLHVSGVHVGKLEFLECNSFKELPHVTLKLFPGSDATIRQFLTFRLSEISGENETLRHGVETKDAECQKAKEDLEVTRRHIAANNSQQYHIVTNLRLNCDSLSAKLHASCERIDTLTNALGEVSRNLESTSSQLSSAQEQIRNLNREKATLMEQIGLMKEQESIVSEVRAQAEIDVAQARDQSQGYKTACEQAEARIEDWKKIASSSEKKAEEAIKELQEVSKCLQESITARDTATESLKQEIDKVEALSSRVKQVEDALETAASRAHELETIVDDQKIAIGTKSISNVLSIYIYTPWYTHTCTSCIHDPIPHIERV